jgi:hypothetical protein
VQQRQPIGLWPGHGVLVSADLAAERLQQDAPQDPVHGRLVGMLGACVAVRIQCGTRTPLQGPVRQPGGEGRRGGGVRIFLGGQLQANRVVWVAGQQGRLLLRGDDVVRGADQVGQVRDGAVVGCTVGESTERTDRGHA